MLNTLKERAKAQEAEKRRSAELGEPESNFDEDRPIEAEASNDDVEVNPTVKHSACEFRPKIDDSQSSREPTLAKFLSTKKGGRIKRVLRKQGAPVTFLRKETPPPVTEDEDNC
ncbi:hypothetical protein LIER_41970 [Lithospermum erythrorhizon]|uniref:Uncharacterized protein n=1 Tax=Lithospermum erythrorhizon TaxID=34254 RepID=A0AAV3RHA5_LITER